jgi:hypothetical protein
MYMQVKNQRVKGSIALVRVCILCARENINHRQCRSTQAQAISRSSPGFLVSELPVPDHLMHREARCTFDSEIFGWCLTQVSRTTGCIEYISKFLFIQGIWEQGSVAPVRICILLRLCRKLEVPADPARSTRARAMHWWPLMLFLPRIQSHILPSLFFWDPSIICSSEQCYHIL